MYVLKQTLSDDHQQGLQYDVKNQMVFQTK